MNTTQTPTFKKAPELLAPAGDFQAFLGAVDAGADAVYLAGNMFGARAYAKNLSAEEIIEALHYAHVHGRKIYLTVNTVTKNEELKELYDFLKPLYLAGLDGVIVQDFGVFSYIRKHFPNLKLHASTQMCITSSYGAEYLKNLGAERVVPARELGLEEIKAINALGIETECFIHGSMCYSYSGQCLFSSFLGGRSGNRGRCAGPCRQPYCLEKSKEEKYLLSLKDLCTIELMPKLIDAGITSFKIEGRMKSAAYAAGVTEVYRKYIDFYLNHPERPYVVEKEDLVKLQSLYLRSDLQDGYYEKNKSPKMVSIKSPSYNKTDDDLCAALTEKYCRKKVPVSVKAAAFFETGKNCEIRIDLRKPGTFLETPEKTALKELVITGDEVLKAMNAPLKEEDLISRLSKSADGYFSLNITEITVSEDAFLPNKAVNDLRRKAEEMLFAEFFRAEEEERKASLLPKGELFKKTRSEASEDFGSSQTEQFLVFVYTKEQFKAARNFVKPGDAIAFPASFFYGGDFADELGGALADATGGDLADSNLKYYMVLPEVFREGNIPNLVKALEKAEKQPEIAGYYVSGPDGLSYLKKQKITKPVFGDQAFYMVNSLSPEVFASGLSGYTLSTELSSGEIANLLANLPSDKAEANLPNPELMIYGRIPLMQTANCVLNTGGKCRREAGFTSITDRKRVTFPIYTHCDEKICYNTICNSVPLSLHKYYETIVSLGVKRLQIRFTDESSSDAERIYRIFDACRNGALSPGVFYDYTNGHFKKGVL